MLLAGSGSSAEERVLEVTATAYNSTVAQTDSTPYEGAWGDAITPGMQVIAVSKDLLEAGLTRGVEVRIDGLRGTWVVLDRMPARHHRRIDLYMGLDVAAARKWGVRSVVLRWRTDSASSSTEPPGQL